MKTDSVGNLMDTTGVNDRIGIRPSLTVTAITSDIEAALKRTSMADAESIGQTRTASC